MKILKALLLILTLVITSASVLAYSVNIDWTMNKQNYEVELYPCSNSDCSNVGSRILYDTSSGYTYHMYYTLSGNAYHAAYFYKPGYRPIGYTLNAWGDWTTSFSDSFTKKNYCESEIGTLSVSDDNPTLGETIIIGAPISSAFTVSDDHSQSPKYYPTSHIDYFTSDILTSLNVYNSAGTLVKTLPSQTKSIYQDDDQSVSFSLDTSSLTAGSYKIVLSTDPVDTICDQGNKIINTKELFITVDPVTPVNTPPVIDGLLDLSFVEDSGLHNDIVDLWFYATDSETSDSGLTFTIISQTNAGIVNCVIDSNRYVDCTTQTDQHGYSDVTVQVTDPEGLTDTDTFRITVTPVNDAPVVSGAGVLDQTIDSCNQFTTFDLDDIISDVDDSDADLTWTVTGNTQLIITVDTSAHTVTVFYPVGFVGSETVTFTATDPDGLTVSDDAVFTVAECASANTAPVVSNIPGQTVDSCDHFDTFDLDDYVTDAQDSDSEILWAVTGDDHLDVSISSDHVVTITYDCGWVGSETLTFTATDPHGLTDSDSGVFKVDADVAGDDHDDDDDDDDKDEGGLKIMGITYDENVKPGDYLHISINVKGLTDGIVTSVRIDDLGIYEKFSKISKINVLIPKNTNPGDYDFYITVKNDDGYKDSAYRSFKVIGDTIVVSGAGTPGDDDHVTGASVTVGTNSGSISNQGQNGFNLEGILGLVIGFIFLLLLLGVLAIFYFFKNTKKKEKKPGLEKEVYYDTTEISHHPVEMSPTMPHRTFHGAEATEKFIYGSQQPSSNTFLIKM